jgi:putative Mn2+ efflux pump MntP
MTRSQKNPLDLGPPPSDAEVIVGGLASIVLIGLGVTLITSALKEASDTTSTLEDTSSLAALAALAPI